MNHHHHQLPTTPNRTSSYPPHDQPSSSSASAAAALRGATLAFQGQKRRDSVGSVAPSWPLTGTTPGSTPTTTTARDNGALRAATQASRSRSPGGVPKARPGMSKQTTGGSAHDVGYMSGGLEPSIVSQRLSQFLGSSSAAGSPYLSPNGPGKTTPDPKSASFIAATLAASRTGSPSPAGQPFAQAPMTPTQLHARIPRRMSSSRSSVLVSSAAASSDEGPDSTPIAPTGNLISAFETKSQSPDTAKDTIQRRVEAGAGARLAGLGTVPKMRTMTPPRQLSPRRISDVAEEASEGEGRGSPVTKKPKPKPKPQPAPTTQAGHHDIASFHTRGAPSRASEKRVEQAPQIPMSKPQIGTEPPVIPRSPQKRSESTALEMALHPAERDGKPEAQRRQAPQEESTTSSVQPAGQRILPPVPTKPRMKPQSLPQATSRPQSQPQSSPSPSLRTQERAGISSSGLEKPELYSPRPARVISSPILNSNMSPVNNSNRDTAAAGWPTLLPRSPRVIADSQDFTREGQQTGSHVRAFSGTSTSSDDTFVSASSTRSPPERSPTRDRDHSAPEYGPRRSQLGVNRSAEATPRSTSAYAVAAHPAISYPRSSTQSVSSTTGSNLALSSLTSAMMASNLAASRSPASTPSRTAPLPPPPRRHNHHPHLLHASHTGGNKSPGRMLQTLRAPAAHSDDEDARRRMDRYRKKHIGGKKKHAHHEGSRRRWRDEITDKERRRYEAVWASNRGLLLDLAQLNQFARVHGRPTAVEQGLNAEDLVASVVVRDLWSRSRLPVDDLAEVWDLVDRSGLGALSKHEFVVGMWLIDQRLRGRKIPASVGASVWASAKDVKYTGPAAKAKNKNKSK